MKKRRPITDGMKFKVLHKARANVLCGVCGYLTKVDDIQFDHWLALVDGGAHSVDNLRPVCSGCHAKKSAREHRANCKAKRLARGKRPSKRPLPKSERKIATRSFTKPPPDYKHFWRPKT